MSVTVTRSVGPRGAIVVRGTATGAAAMSERMEVGEPTQIKWIGFHLSAAPTTSEDLTVTRDADAGATYDVTLLTTDPSETSATNISWTPDEPFVLMPGDAVAVAYTNTDTKTWTVSIVGEVL
jgi:hypothetical protein